MDSFCFNNCSLKERVTDCSFNFSAKLLNSSMVTYPEREGDGKRGGGDEMDVGEGEGDGG